MTAHLVSILLSALFLLFPAPLMMALVIITQALLVSLLTYMTLATSWLSFVLMLVFISAMMVVYAYVASLASNDFFYSRTHLPLSLPLLITTLIVLFTLDQGPLDLSGASSLAEPDLTSTPMSVSKLYAPGAMAVTVFLVIYLLVSLVAVAKNASYCSGPLRSSCLSPTGRPY
uniref:NADH dehydrogenase subunit 6 n=1 Tax=Macrohectopus branickii TaxID=65455 RepID=UPI001D10B34C|nr:NADH dehydrogenase subunit 6 [Macrohectopus branickii]UCL27452.1 NADH dehydrogenase subunit 6 [Macrohectopus branickii]